MKGAVVAALHALAALRAVGAPTPEVVLQAVASEEDGGLGTFAALERDAAFDAALLPEPTGLRVVCAQAGALTFRGVVRGRSAHAAERLAGVSAIDRYVRVHAALARARDRGQRGRRAPADARAASCPTRCSSGAVAGGDWSSQVPDRLEFEGRLGVPVGADLRRGPRGAAGRRRRARSTTARRRASWSGRAARSRPARRAPDHPWVQTVRGALRDELGRDVELAGVPWGADMRLFTARGIPAVMVGTTRDRARARASTSRCRWPSW